MISRGTPQHGQGISFSLMRCSSLRVRRLVGGSERPPPLLLSGTMLSRPFSASNSSAVCLLIVCPVPVSRAESTFADFRPKAARLRRLSCFSSSAMRANNCLMRLWQSSRLSGRLLGSIGDFGSAMTLPLAELIPQYTMPPYVVAPYSVSMTKRLFSESQVKECLETFVMFSCHLPRARIACTAGQEDPAG